MSINSRSYRLYKKNIACSKQRSIYDLVAEEQYLSDGMISLDFDSGLVGVGADDFIKALIINLSAQEQGKESDDFMEEDKLVQLGIEFVNAANRRDHQTMKRYIDNEYPVNFQHPKSLETALHAAAWNNDVEAIKMLLDTGKCDLLISDRYGKIPATNSVVRYENEEAANLIAEATRKAAKEAGINSSKFTAERLAEYWGKLYPSPDDPNL
jgi:hypothetical protein